MTINLAGRTNKSCFVLVSFLKMKAGGSAKGNLESETAWKSASPKSREDSTLKHNSVSQKSVVIISADMKDHLAFAPCI